MGGQRVAAPRATTSDPPASPGIATPSPGRLLSIAFPPTCRPLRYRYYIYTTSLSLSLSLESTVILSRYRFIAAAVHFGDV